MIYKRSGRYAVRVDLDCGPNGKRRRKSIGTFATRKEAEKAERDALSERDAGIDLAPGVVTVAQLLERYLTRCRTKGLSPTTIDRYGQLERTHITPTLGGLLLRKLRPAHLTALYAAVADAGAAPKTVHHVHGLLHASLNWAVEHQLVVRNVADVVAGDLPKVPRSPAKALTPAQATALLNAARPTPWYAFVALALCVGTRRGELAGLRWERVDLEAATIIVACARVRTSAGPIDKSTKTDAVRTVPLNATAVAALRAHRAAQNEERLAAGTRYCKEDYVFANPLGKPWHPTSITNAFGRLARIAGIPPSRLHDLRHTAATWLLRSGVDVATVAAILGHSVVSTTLNTYAHVLPGADVSAVATIDAQLGR